jgi:hypothetical protein
MDTNAAAVLVDVLRIRLWRTRAEIPAVALANK